MVTRTIGFFSLAEAPGELPAEHTELEGHIANRHACGDVWKVSGPSPYGHCASRYIHGSNCRKAPQCPVLAQSRHSRRRKRCPLLEVKRTSQLIETMPAFDPFRTSADDFGSASS